MNNTTRDAMLCVTDKATVPKWMTEWMKNNTEVSFLKASMRMQEYILIIPSDVSRSSFVYVKTMIYPWNSSDIWQWAHCARRCTAILHAMKRYLPVHTQVFPPTLSPTGLPWPIIHSTWFIDTRTLYWWVVPECPSWPLIDTTAVISPYSMSIYNYTNYK